MGRPAAPILLPYILLPRVRIPLILVADKRNETANSRCDKGCHAHGLTNIHQGLK